MSPIPSNALYVESCSDTKSMQYSHSLPRHHDAIRKTLCEQFCGVAQSLRSCVKKLHATYCINSSTCFMAASCVKSCLLSHVILEPCGNIVFVYTSTRITGYGWWVLCGSLLWNVTQLVCVCASVFAYELDARTRSSAYKSALLEMTHFIRLRKFVGTVSPRATCNQNRTRLIILLFKIKRIVAY